MQGGKRLVLKIEQRVHELEAELEAEQLRHGETVKAIRKQVNIMFSKRKYKIYYIYIINML